MARFRLFEQAPQYCDATGTPYAGGSLNFYDTGTSTPRNVYTLPTGGVSLGSTLTLASDGRYNGDYWLDGEYRVILKDADGVTIHTRDNVRDVATGGIVPLDPTTGNDGDVYTTDGVTASWQPVLALPDPTGHDGEYLVADGATAIWQALATYSSTNLPGGVVQTGSTSFQIGKLLVQFGSGTLPINTGAPSSNVAVTFGTTYTGSFIGMVACLTGSGGQMETGAKATLSCVGSTSGATVYGFIGDEHDTPPGYTFASTGPFFYVAFGLMA